MKAAGWIIDPKCGRNRLSVLRVRKCCPPSERSFAGSVSGSSCTPRNRERLRRGYPRTLPNHGSYSQDTSHVENFVRNLRVLGSPGKHAFLGRGGPPQAYPALFVITCGSGNFSLKGVRAALIRKTKPVDGWHGLGCNRLWRLGEQTAQAYAIA